MSVTAVFAANSAPSPSISSIQPGSSGAPSSTNFKISGNGLAFGVPEFRLNNQLQLVGAFNINNSSDTELLATLSVGTHAVGGSYAVSVRTPSGISNTVAWIVNQFRQFALNVIKAGTGTGTVTGGGINCGTTCTANVGVGSQVALTATADAGSTFSNWVGACGGTGPCTVTMSDERSVKAVFVSNAASPPNITSIQPNSGFTPETLYHSRCKRQTPARRTRQFRLNNSISQGINLVGIDNSSDTQFLATLVMSSGVAAGNHAVSVVTPAGTSSATVTLTPTPQYTVAVLKNGLGSGTVRWSNFVCGNGCSWTLDHGVVVSLTAEADDGSTFVGWSGPCTGTGSCTFTVDRAWNVVATFNPATATPVSIANSLSVSTIAGLASYPGIEDGVGSAAHFGYADSWNHL